MPRLKSFLTSKEPKAPVLAQHTQKLAGLMAAGSLFQSRMSQTATLESMAQQVAQTMGADACIIARHGKENGLLKALSTYGFSGVGRWENMLSDKRALFSWVMRYQRPFVMAGHEKELRRYIPGFLSDMKMQSCLVVPLTANSETVGLIGLFDTKPNVFDETDCYLLTLCSTQVATTVRNYEMFSKIKRDFLETVKAFAAIIDFNDTYTHGHSEQVMHYSAQICDQYPLSQEEREHILYGSFLHDIGKIGVPTSVLRKPARLNQVEWEQMVAHAQIGADIVSQIESLKPFAPYILHHHAWFRGGGYPDPDLCGEAIPLGARILAVADAYEAMTSDRPYRRAMSHETAAEQLRKFGKVQFDPNVVEAFLSGMD